MAYNLVTAKKNSSQSSNYTNFKRVNGYTICKLPFGVPLKVNLTKRGRMIATLIQVSTMSK